MTQVFLLSAAEAALKGVDPSERGDLVADLHKLPHAPAKELKVADKVYRAAALSNGWAAIYRDLEPDEVKTISREHAIAVMDLLPINQEQGLAVAGGPVTA